MKPQWQIEHAGPDAVLIRFGEQINTDLVPVIRAATKRLQKELQEEIRGLVPSYTTLMLCYDPRKNDFPAIQDKIQQQLANLDVSQSEMGKLIEIPVWYDPAVGPDLQHVANFHQISIDDVIRRHSDTIYHIFAIGFAPGFAYMAMSQINLQHQDYKRHGLMLRPALWPSPISKQRFILSVHPAAGIFWAAPQ